MHDPVNHPQHYTKHKSGVECIQITEHMSFTLGNAIKYIWRADLKNGIEDLEKAKWYLEREIAKRKLAEPNFSANQLINSALDSISSNQSTLSTKLNSMANEQTEWIIQQFAKQQERNSDASKS